MAKRRKLIIGGHEVRAGETRTIHLPISQTYTGEPILLPVRVIRAKKTGPRVALTAAIHGDEINGTGIIRELLFGRPLRLKAGTLISIPVINVFGFESGERDMPDRRDLNRSFPGSTTGSLASRVAHRIFTEITEQCDWGIDLHTGSADRTNYPNVRGDLSVPGVKRLAEAFGCELIINNKGPEGSLREAACNAGCPTIILEAGEVLKMEPAVIELGVRGVRNVLIDLGMLEGVHQSPAFQAIAKKTTWVRAELGGLLRFHVAPGDLIEGGQPIATNESVFGDAHSIIISPVEGLVLGMITHPAVKPGEPVCHIAMPHKSVRSIRKLLERASARNMYSAHMKEELGRRVPVYRPISPPHR